MRFLSVSNWRGPSHMVTWILVLPILAAALHATWNALVKTAADRLVTLAFVAFATTVAGVVLLLFVDLPDRASWLFIGLSILIKYLYYTFVYLAYRAGDLSLVYPLARGTTPLLVAAGAALFADEFLSMPALLGVIVACLGISSLAIVNLTKLQGSYAPIVLAIGTGFIIAASTLCDGIGVRASKSPLGFTAVVSVMMFPIVVFALFFRRDDIVHTIRLHWQQGMIAGTCSVLAYGLVMYAAAFAPLSIVAALRETGVVMAALIGTILLGERPWQGRVAASMLVLGGVALMTTYR